MESRTNKDDFVGPDRDQARRSSVVAQVADQMEKVRKRLSGIRHKVAILSGKGGVGKSMVSVNLASSLAMEGYRVGILDADINGPSIPIMLGIDHYTYESTPDGVSPAVGFLGIRSASMGILLEDSSSPVRWKAPGKPAHAVWEGAMEMSVIREFLGDFAWGNLDFLLIDLPPGTGDKPALMTQLIPDIDGAIVVTIPSKVCRQIVEKSIRFCADLRMPVLGLVENMSHTVCSECGNKISLFSRERDGLDADSGSSPTVSVPFDPKLSLAADEGKPYLVEHPKSPVSAAFRGLARALPDLLLMKNEYLARL